MFKKNKKTTITTTATDGVWHAEQLHRYRNQHGFFCSRIICVYLRKYIYLCSYHVIWKLEHEMMGT